MNLNDEYTVLEDGVEIGTFDTYEQAFEHMKKHAAVGGHKYQFVRKLFRKEKELPTIAETGWKDEYRGMWADVDCYSNPALILGVDEDNDILMWDFTNPRVLWAYPGSVRPRPDLAQVELPPPHPAYLKTLGDYENAPTYTMIGSAWSANFPSLVKDISGKWTEIGSDSSGRSAIFAGDRRKVLYWPPQEEGGASA